MKFAVGRIKYKSLLFLAPKKLTCLSVLNSYFKESEPYEIPLCQMDPRRQTGNATQQALIHVVIKTQCWRQSDDAAHGKFNL